jgi:hypothetical protein
VWSTGEADPDKEAAACVWLWARDSRLCNGPKLAGPAFDDARADAQLRPGIQCVLGRHVVTRSQLGAIARLTGDPESALSALHARLVLAQATDLSADELRAAEAAVVAQSFRGSWSAYRAALARAGMSPALARAILSHEAREAKVRDRLRAPAPTATQVADYQLTFASLAARPVEVGRPVSWLGGRRAGLALDGLAPRAVFSLPAGKRARLQTPAGRLRVRATGPAMPLGAYPAALARPAITAALIESARLAKFQTWLLGRQTAALRSTVCLRDELPLVEPVDLTEFLPFLALD